MSGDDSRFVETVVNDRSAIITVSAGSTPGGCLEHRAGFGNRHDVFGGMLSG